jgi:hypothetical protein
MLGFLAERGAVVAPAEEQIEHVKDRRGRAAGALDALEDRHGEGRDRLCPDHRVDIKWAGWVRVDLDQRFAGDGIEAFRDR